LATTFFQTGYATESGARARDRRSELRGGQLVAGGVGHGPTFAISSAWPVLTGLWWWRDVRLAR